MNTRMEAKVEIEFDEKAGRFSMVIEGLPHGGLAFPIAFTALEDHAIKAFNLPRNSHLCNIVNAIKTGAAMTVDDPTLVPKSRKWKEETDVH